MKPGLVLKHKVAKAEMVVIELEGEGATGWFTVRLPDMSTWRVCYEECEAVQPPVDWRQPGQYL